MRSACIAVVAATAFSADFNYDTYDGTLDCTNPVAIKAPYCWPVTFKTQDGAGGAANCAGKEQSPINIAQTTPSQKLKLPKFTSKYAACNSVDFFNNGHSIEAKLDQCGFAAEFNNTEYDLLQVHLHSPSEHTIGGASFDGELHLVHKSKDGKYMVVGVLLNSPSSSGGAAPATNSFIDKFLGLGANPLTGKPNSNHTSIFDTIPQEPTTPNLIAVDSFNPYTEVLPADPTFYNYAGSFTTPPCTQGVNWVLMAQPVSVSSAQMKIVRQKLSKVNKVPDKSRTGTNIPDPTGTNIVGEYRNDRPVQELNGRVVTIEYGSSEEVEPTLHEVTFWYSSMLKPVGELFGFIGVMVMIFGGLIAMANLFKLCWKELTGKNEASAFLSAGIVTLSVVRVQFAKSVILSLEILVAADVIDTLAKPVEVQTFTQLGLIGIVVVIRTVLSLHLGHEMHEIKLANGGHTSRRASSEETPLTAGGVSSSDSTSANQHSNPGVPMGDMSGSINGGL